ncbi:DUF3152 domain-containing protein [Streptomyces lincolnensis]|uniref:DUF3152 domain-containing protein n=1 Tax=Streptomyces lincolnensis TaxID=1915 RepID=UPI0037D75A2D
MGRHSRRGPAPKSAPKGDHGSGDGTTDVTGAASRTRVSGRSAPVGGLPPGFEYGTPAHGIPRLPDGTPARGVPQVRGGHPEHREAGGGWGEPSGRGGAGYGGPGSAGPAIPHQRPAPPRGPRQDYLEAFEGDDDVFARRAPSDGRRVPSGAPRTRTTALASDPYGSDPYGSVTDWPADTGVDRLDRLDDLDGVDGTDIDDVPPTGEPAPDKGAKGRTFTGIAAAAVTTVLAIVVAGQVADGGDDSDVRSQSASDQARDARDSASRIGGRPTPSEAPGAAPLTYEQAMGRMYPLESTLKAAGKFDAIPGIAKGPATGQKYTYRVDVEQGLGLDGELFAQAVQKTLNDDRSWAHNGALTFERVYSGKTDFVITLASPGTTADWCAKSGLDTTEDNVSCDSAATERVMINAYRWAQGSETYGDDQIYAYRQMLINHEVGHRLGHGHVTCDKNGDLAPVMQQQTKFLDHDGIRCKANPWPYPRS